MREGRPLADAVPMCDSGRGEEEKERERERAKERDNDMEAGEDNGWPENVHHLVFSDQSQ